MVADFISTHYVDKYSFSFMIQQPAFFEAMILNLKGENISKKLLNIVCTMYVRYAEING